MKCIAFHRLRLFNKYMCGFISIRFIFLRHILSRSFIIERTFSYFVCLLALGVNTFVKCKKKSYLNHYIKNIHFIK